MKFNKKRKSIFLDIDSPSFRSKEKIDVILSPALYWVKKLTLPVKYTRDAKKLLPSLFEDSLDAGKYSYDVYKKGEDFFAFAYQDNVILELLKEKGIAPSQIVHIYFAQSEFSTIQTPLKIDDKKTLVLQDGVVLLVPNVWVSKSQKLDVSNIVHSKHRVNLVQYSQFIESKLIYKMSAVLSIFTLIFFIQYYFFQEKLYELEQKQESLFTKHHLKPTMFQNKSLLKKYNKTHLKQMKIRKAIGDVLSLHLKNGHGIYSIELKQKKLVVLFDGVEKSKESYIKNMLKKKKIHFSSYFKKDNFYVEVPL